MRGNLLRRAATGAAESLERGYGSTIKRSEQRLRQALVDALELQPKVAEVRFQPEWRPEMPSWPHLPKSKLGGFDLAIMFVGETNYSAVAELKWCARTGLDSFDEMLWDLFKLAHARATLDCVDTALLLYGAPDTAWTHARFGALFDGTLVSSRMLISENEGVWRWLLKGSAKSRPKRLPPYIQTDLLSDSAFVHNGATWRLKVTSVRANGEPWVELANGWPRPDRGEQVVLDWPFPEPGAGMVPDDPSEAFQWPQRVPPSTPNEQLRRQDVPGPNATWHEIVWFAAQLDGYEAAGGAEELFDMAARAGEEWRERQTLPADFNLTQLRALLFHVYRGMRFVDSGVPSRELTPYVRALIDAIRSAVADR